MSSSYPEFEERLLWSQRESFEAGPTLSQGSFLHPFKEKTCSRAIDIISSSKVDPHASRADSYRGVSENQNINWWQHGVQTTGTALKNLRTVPQPVWWSASGMSLPQRGQTRRSGRARNRKTRETGGGIPVYDHAWSRQGGDQTGFEVLMAKTFLKWRSEAQNPAVQHSCAPAELPPSSEAEVAPKAGETPNPSDAAGQVTASLDRDRRQHEFAQRIKPDGSVCGHHVHEKRH